MKIALRFALALALLATLATLWTFRRHPPGHPAAAAVVLEQTDEPEPPTRPSAPAAREAAEPELGSAESDPAESEPRPAAGASVPAARPETARVQGRVLDCAGFGLAGVAVGLEGGPASAIVSGGGGVFELVAPLRRARVIARDPRHETVLAGSFDPERAAEVVIVVATRLALAGRVIDAQGAPLEGVELQVVARRPLELSFARTLDGAGTRAWSCRSGAQGRFEFASVPALPGGALVASRSGYLASELPLFAHDVHDLLVVLERPAESPGLVRGLVLDAEGRPVPAARVAAHPATTTSDEHGRFELLLDPEPVEALLVAVKRGLGACARVVERDPEEHPLWPDPVVLVLDGALGAVTGRVVDDERTPLAGVRVWLADPTSAGLVDGAPGHAENLSHDEGAHGWSYVVTDQAGGFRLEGLLERRYRVRALDERTLLQVEASEVRRGDELELVLPTASLPGKVAGRVIDARGKPLAGVQVLVTRPTYRGVAENGWAYTDGLHLEPALTDEEGRFELAPFSLDGTFVHLESEEVFPDRLDFSGQDDPSDLTLVARLRVHVQVELGLPGTWADAFELQDEHGEPVWLTQLRGGRSGVYTRAPLLEGRSVVWTVPETARTLVLYSGEGVVRQQAVSLGPGEVNVLRF